MDNIYKMILCVYFAYAYVCACVCVLVCMFTFVRVCMCTFVCVCLSIYLCACVTKDLQGIKGRNWMTKWKTKRVSTFKRTKRVSNVVFFKTSSSPLLWYIETIDTVFSHIKEN